MRFLLKPGWLAFIAGVIAFSVACYTLLAPWQFRRNAERERDNAAIAASQANPPVPLARLVPLGTAPAQDIEWRRVTVRGRYLPAGEAAVRLRSVLSDPAYEVLTAFRTDDGRTIAVDRGYLRPVEGTGLPPYPAAPDGEVTLTGRLRLDENDPRQRAPLQLDGRFQLYSADSRQLARILGQPVTPGYLALLDGQPGILAELPLPDTDAGPFLSYAWQWLTFGLMALFGLGYFIRLELLQRRPRDVEEDSAEEDVEVDPMVARYGRQRF